MNWKFSAVAVAMCMLLSGSPAAARIACVNGMQQVGGQLISTPYCQDAYLADVAREYGMKHSAEAIRNNPNIKREVCRFVGHDIRINSNCPEQRSPRGGR